MQQNIYGFYIYIKLQPFTILSVGVTILIMYMEFWDWNFFRVEIVMDFGTKLVHTY